MWRARQRFGQQDARTLDDGRQPFPTLAQRKSGQVLTIEMKQIEGIEHDRVVAVRRSMLERLKRGFAVPIQRDDLAVEDRRLRVELPTRVLNHWVRGREVVLLPRHEPHAISTLQQ